VETAVRNKDDSICFAGKDRGSTTKDLTRRERLCLNGRGREREAGLCLLSGLKVTLIITFHTWLSDGSYLLKML
jgi:hypothetical protein